MVSQRQRLAQKRYKEAHPELFPKPEPTPPKDPNKKKKSKFKRKKPKTKEVKTGNKPDKSTHRKHPLRVPGMRPGESCFICKAQDHIAKHCPQKAQWEKNKICLHCRHRGHTMKNCPSKNEKTMDKKLCYNCGETGHSLTNCPQPIQDGGSRFASCFICNERGHLSKNCPRNTHGIYPKGGCCKICGDVTHLAKDCPDKGNRGLDGADKGSMEVEDVPQHQRVIKFVSGDDLEDDFTTEDIYSSAGNKDKSSMSKDGPDSNSKTSSVKLKKRQGHKVVNFVG